MLKKSKEHHLGLLWIARGYLVDTVRLYLVVRLRNNQEIIISSQSNIIFSLSRILLQQLSSFFSLKFKIG